MVWTRESEGLTVPVGDFLGVARECDGVAFGIDVELFGLGAEVFTEGFEDVGADTPVVFGTLRVE